MVIYRGYSAAQRSDSPAQTINQGFLKSRNRLLEIFLIINTVVRGFVCASEII